MVAVGERRERTLQLLPRLHGRTSDHPVVRIFLLSIIHFLLLFGVAIVSTIYPGVCATQFTASDRFACRNFSAVLLFAITRRVKSTTQLEGVSHLQRW
jgi:hypothetical protein